MDFWLVWVPGRDAPKRLHDSYESALREATKLRANKTTREVYILAPVHRIEGRKLLRLPRNGISAANRNLEVEPRVAEA